MFQCIRYFDDFYSNPLEVRSYALMGNFQSTQNMFTGKEFVSEKFPMQSVYSRLGYFLQEKFYTNPLQKGVFRSLTEEQYINKKNTVHIDKMGISCLICLNEEYQEDIYTGLYRHKETGLEGITDKKKLNRKAASFAISTNQLIEQVCSDGFNMDKWEEVDRVPYKFNRLIVFDSNLFHAAAAGFGHSQESAKLTQNFRFHSYKPFRLQNLILFGKAWR